MEKSDYDRVTYLNGWKEKALIASTVFTVLFTLNEKYRISEKYNELKDYIDVLISFNLVIILTYVILDNRANYIFNKAERVRRFQYLDNSFDTSFAGNRISNYFSQDNLTPGFYKLAVNCFENTFHTFNIVRKMQFKTYRLALIVFIVFVFSAAVGEKGIVRALIEAILPLALIQDAVRTMLFINKLEHLYDSFKSLFNSWKESPFVNKEPEAMKQVIDYETTLAWASMPLDSKIFKKEQSTLATEWEILKTEYKITSI